MDNEFYYPLELQDGELLQQATYVENYLCSEEEIRKFVSGQKRESTVKKTAYDLNIFKSFLDLVNEEREIYNIPGEEFDQLLCNFYMTVKRKDGAEYEPDTISSITRSTQRHLDDNNMKLNILKDEAFKMSREVLKAKRRQLRKQGKGNKPNATVPLTEDDVEKFFEENQFGLHNPEALSRTMWYLITLHFGHRAPHEARQLKFGDILLKFDTSSNEEYIEWMSERETKTRHGDENEQHRSFYPKAYATCDKRCPVACYKEFVLRRPEESKSPESAFFSPLTIDVSLTTKYGSLTDQWGRIRSVSLFQVPQKSLPTREERSPTTPYEK